MKTYWTSERVKRELEKQYVMYVKYVRLNTGEFRFGDGSNMYFSHSDMVEKGKDVPVSAGTIKMKMKVGWCFETIGSTTLGISPIKCLPDDQQQLEQLLGMKYVNGYDIIIH